MNIDTFLLFAACLLFGGFNMYLNLKSGEKWLRTTTIRLMILGIICALFLIVYSFWGLFVK